MTITLMLLVGGAALGLVLSFAAVPADLRRALGNPANAANLQELARVFFSLLPKALAMGGMLVGIRFVHHRPVGSVFTDGRPFRIAFAVESAAVWALLWFAGVLAQPHGWEHLAQRAGEVSPAWWPVLAFSLVWVVGLLIWFGWLLWATRSRPAGSLTQPDGASISGQPIRSKTNRASEAAGSCR